MQTPAEKKVTTMSSYGYQSDPYATTGGGPYAAQSDPYAADPYAAQTGYSAPQHYPAGGGYVQPPPTNTMALLSLIMSLVGIATGGMTSILGIIFGHIGRKQIKRTGEGGDQMALWGLIVGYVVLGLWILFWVIYVVFIVGVVALGIWSAETTTY